MENLYSVKTILPGKVFYVHLQVGFKVKYTVKTLFKKVVKEMVLNGEVDEKSRYASLRRYDFEPDFKFVFVKSMVSSQNELSRMNRIAMATYSKLYNLGYPVYKEFGLDTSTILEEIVPLNYTLKGDLNLKRLD